MPIEQLKMRSKKCCSLFLLIAFSYAVNMYITTASAVSSVAEATDTTLEYKHRYHSILPEILAVHAPERNKRSINNDGNFFDLRRHATLSSVKSGMAIGVGGAKKSISSNHGGVGNGLSHNSAEVATNLDMGIASAVDSGSAVGVGEVMIPKSFPINAQEPTCEQLRAMWIFSKRQSRAAEITNEIPTYRDPFTYNIWEPYSGATTRSVGAVRMMPHYSERLPIFGRVLNREPQQQKQHQRESGIVGQRIAFSHINNAGHRSRSLSQYRHVGPGGPSIGDLSGSPTTEAALISGAGGIGVNTVAPVQGSFQKLKELIWTERAKELTHQRRAEELAARAAVLKEIANGQSIYAKNNNNEFSLKSDSPYMEENRSPYVAVDYQRDSSASESDSSAPRRGGGVSSVVDRRRNDNLDSSASHAKQSTDVRSYFIDHRPFIELTNGGVAFNRNYHSHYQNNQMQPPQVHRIITTSKHDSGMPVSLSNGATRAYPMRPSHFRERNRAMFKQNIPRRSVRNSVLPQYDDPRKIRYLSLHHGYEDDSAAVNDRTSQIVPNKDAHDEWCPMLLRSISPERITHLSEYKGDETIDSDGLEDVNNGFIPIPRQAGDLLGWLSGEAQYPHIHHKYPRKHLFDNVIASNMIEKRHRDADAFARSPTQGSEHINYINTKIKGQLETPDSNFNDAIVWGKN